MRVLHFTNNRLPPREGIAGAAATLTCRMRARGVDAHLLAKRVGLIGRSSFDLGDAGATLYAEPPLRPFHHALARPAIQRWIDERLGPDDVFHLHWPMAPRIETRARRVTTVHTPLASDVAAIGEPGLKPRLIRWNARRFSLPLERWHIERSDALFAVSRAVAEDVDRAHPGAGATVLPNGVDARYFSYSADCERKDFLYVGRLGYRKGLERLLRAFAAMRSKATLDLVGDGPLRRDLEKLSARLGIEERVRFHGQRGPSYVAGALRRCAVFVQPADYEGCALSILEAMASGAPVVATPVGYAGDLAALPDAPIFTSERSVEALANAMDRAAVELGEARKRAERARLLIEEAHDWERVVDRLLDAYRGGAAAA